MKDDNLFSKNFQLDESIDEFYTKDLILERFGNESSNITENLFNFNYNKTCSDTYTPIPDFNKGTLIDYSDYSVNKEEFKNRNYVLPINSSFNNLEKILNNSFTYLLPVNINQIQPKINVIISTKSDEIKKFSCSFIGCKKIYKSKENLTLHFKNIHLKEKPYSCKYCKSLFSHRNGKTYHERRFHTKYFPHKCSIEDCDLKFASKSALNYHFKSNHLRTKRRYRNIKSKFNDKILKVLQY